MADDPTEVVRELYEAVELGDHRRVEACLSPDLRWRQAAAAVPAAGQEVVGARALIERVLRPFEERWDGFTEELEELHACGDRVVAVGTYGGVFLPTGRRLQAEFCHVWTVAEGRITRFRQFTDTAAFAEVTTGAG